MTFNIEFRFTPYRNSTVVLVHFYHQEMIILVILLVVLSIRSLLVMTFGHQYIHHCLNLELHKYILLTPHQNIP